MPRGHSSRDADRCDKEKAESCRPLGLTSGEEDSVGFGCASLLLISPDGRFVASVVPVVHFEVSCWANGDRCGEGSSTTLRSILVLFERAP